MRTINERRDVVTCYNDFKNEINKLKDFDNINTTSFSNSQLTSGQLELMSESIFFAAYRAYEGFIRELFILYSLGESHLNTSVQNIVSYVNPRDFIHAESFIKSSAKFAEWNNPDDLISRAEVFFDDGYPIKLIYTSHKVVLNDYKRIRNHIAHNSSESETQYKKVVKIHHNGVLPSPLPSVGAFLRLSHRRIGSYGLLIFLDTLLTIADQLTTPPSP